MESPSIETTSQADQRFGGVERLYGRGSLDRLRAAHIAVIGVGGVGSWTVEALARSGIGAITLIDMDDVCVTNFNRQLPAIESEFGRPKAAVLAERVRQINPDCEVRPVVEFFTERSCDRQLEPHFDFVVDATDLMSTKARIIAKCRERGLRVLTVGGSGGRRDPTQVRVGDLGQSGGDRLLKVVRVKLRRDYGWARGEGNFYDVPTVFSSEPQVFPWASGEVCATAEPGSNLRMDCASGFGAACFVTGAFGFVAAGEIVRRIVAR